MYPVNTHLKPVIGLDIHFVNIPFPCPLPHPYIGLVIDPFDYIPFIGSTISVNGVPRGVTNTMGKIITFVHIPFGAGFTLFPIIGHDSQNFFGNLQIHADGTPLSGSNYMLMTCNDIGIPLSIQPGKKFIPIPSLYLPTSYCIPLQWGPPVMMGGPLVPHFDLLGFLKGYLFGAFFKLFGKVAAKVFNKLKSKLKLKFKSSKANAKPKTKCKNDPVDVTTGRVFYEYTDFELPGPVPLSWKRVWHSDSTYTGVLGHGQHLCFDRHVELYEDDGGLAVMLEDGRAAFFPWLQLGDTVYNPLERLTLTRKQNGHFLLEDHANKLYLHFNHPYRNNIIYKLSFIENYSGNRIQLHYNGKQLAGITDSAGRRIMITAAPNGCIGRVEVRHRDLVQTMVTYDYNEAFDLTGITDAMGQRAALEYDEGHLMIRKTDRNGHSFYWEYDKYKRCIHTWGDGGLQTGYFDFTPGCTVYTNGLGETTTYFYNGDNLILQETDAYGASRFTDYTETGEIHRQVDEEGNVTGFVYDGNNQLQEMVKPDGGITRYQHNGFHALSLVEYAGGGSETCSYDELKRVTHINYPNGNFTSYEYDDDGMVASITSRGGRTTLLFYDADGNVIKTVLPDGGIMQWKYDALGRCIAAINTEGQSRSYTYDALGRVEHISLPDGNRIQLKYNAYDEVVLAADNESAVQFEYTPLGSIKSRRQEGQLVLFNYDTEERLVSVVNPANKYYLFGYNHRGEITKETGFDGVQRLYQRDKAGNVLTTLRPGGRFTKYEYDGNGKVLRAEHYDGSWELYNYDRNGEVTEATNEHGQVKFIRNKSGLVEAEMQDGYAVLSEFDAMGNRVGITSSLGANIEIKRNAFGMPVQLDAGVGNTSWNCKLQYNQAGQELERLMGGNVKIERSYDEAGRAASQKIIAGNVLTGWKKYNWDVNDRLTSIFDEVHKHTTQFKHDALGNLVWAQYAGNEIVQRITDKTGNLHQSENTTINKYNPAGGLLENASHIFKYDPEGNLTSRTNKLTGKSIKHEWYGNGLLKQVIREDGAVVAFKYDALGRRTEKTFKGLVTRWVWDGAVPLHEWRYQERERPQPVVNEWGELVTDKTEPNPQTLPDAITWIFDADSFRPTAKICHGNTYSIVTDHLGTPEMMFDETGEKVWEGVLDIYGRTRSVTGDAADMPFRYQGQYADAETGLFYNRFRYYSPEEGSYISRDPIGLQGRNPNEYGYVKDVNRWLDRFGLDVTYYPLDALGRPTGGLAEISQSQIGTGTSAGSYDPPGWEGGTHPYHQERGHLIAKNHGGSGTDPRNIVTITDGTNHPGMTKHENAITRHVKKGNTVLVEVIPHYEGTNKVPGKISIFAIDQKGNVIADAVVDNGLRKNTACCCK